MEIWTQGVAILGNVVFLAGLFILAYNVVGGIFIAEFSECRIQESCGTGNGSRRRRNAGWKNFDTYD